MLEAALDGEVTVHAREGSAPGPELRDCRPSRVSRTSRKHVGHRPVTLPEGEHPDLVRRSGVPDRGEGHAIRERVPVPLAILELGQTQCLRAT